MSALAPGRALSAGRPRLRDRVVILAWCAWLFGSWLTCLAIDSTVPAVRWMVFACLIGLGVAWPLVRLSEQASADPVWPMARDALHLIVVWQLVIWPLWLSAGWGLEACIWLNATVTAWALLAGALGAAGRLAGNGTGRTLAMGACVALLFGEPLLMALPGLAGAAPWHWPMRVSPIEWVWGLARGSAIEAHPGPHVAAVSVAAIGAWAAVAGFARRF